MDGKRIRIFKWLCLALIGTVILWGVDSVQAQASGKVHGKTSKRKVTSPPKNWIVDYDAVVVGASLGGLITGAILSRNGLKTVVVEKTDVVGGHLGAMPWHGHWLDYGHRDAEDLMDNFFIYNKEAQFYRKAAEAAGVKIPLTILDLPALVHVRTPDNKVGKVVPWDPTPEGWMRLGTEMFHLSPEQIAKLKSVLAGLAAEDPEKWLSVTFKEWLPKAFPSPQDEAIRKFLLFNAMISFVFPAENMSVGRFIKVIKNPVVTARANDPKVGSLQGSVEPFARAIKKYGGEIKLDLQTEEILMQGSRVTGIVVRDKTSSIQTFRAPVVVFALPIWKVFKVLDESNFPKQVVADAWKLEQAFRGDNIMLYLGVSRLPTIRATGKPDTFKGWNQFQDLNGFQIATLASPSIAPPGKHMFWLQWCTGGPSLSSQGPFRNFEEAKSYVDRIREYMRQYYSDLDEITEWENYQWTKTIASAGFFWPIRRGSLRVDGLDGLYFVGSAVESEGHYADVDADSALRATNLILERRKRTGK